MINNKYHKSYIEDGSYFKNKDYISKSSVKNNKFNNNYINDIIRNSDNNITAYPLNS